MRNEVELKAYESCLIIRGIARWTCWINRGCGRVIAQLDNGEPEVALLAVHGKKIGEI